MTLATDIADDCESFDGTETVTYYATDAATGLSVPNSLVRALNSRQIQVLSTLGVEGIGMSIRLWSSQTGAIAPQRGGRIDRTDGTKWRIQAIDTFSVIGSWRCICSEVRT